MRSVFSVAIGAFVAGCNASTRIAPADSYPLLTDSAEFHVRYEAPRYVTRIGWRFTNPTGVTLSTNYCQQPAPPALQKRVNGQWVVAPDDAVAVPLCQAIPPFRLPPNETYRSTRLFRTPGPNVGMDPMTQVDSINGTYRLRWGLRVGPDPDAPGAATIEAVSNEFRLTVVGPIPLMPSR